VTWGESASDLALRKEARELHMRPPLPPPPATEASVLIFSADQISALEITSPVAVTIYSFCPKFGTAFFTTQSHDLSGEDTHQVSVISLCEFSWNK
jgi:hypothetical protein